MPSEIELTLIDPNEAKIRVSTTGHPDLRGYRWNETGDIRKNRTIAKQEKPAMRAGGDSFVLQCKKRLAALR